MKKSIILASLITLISAGNIYAASDVSITSNGKVIEFPNDQKPAVIDSQVYIPARYTAEHLGCEVEWDGTKAIIKNKTGVLTCNVGDNSAVVKENGKYRTRKIFIENDRIYVPIEYILQNLNLNSEIKY